jgi:hypothetical protein
MSTDDFDTLTPDDDEVLAGLHRSVSGATMTTSAADVVALGRRTRNRHRVVAAGIGTSAAALVAAIGMLAPSTGSGTPNAVAQGAVSTVPASTAGSSADRLMNIQEAGFSLVEHSAGVFTLKLDDVFDAAKLRGVLDQAGVPSAILVTQVPEGWDLSRGIRCTPDPGVRFETNAEGVFTKDLHAGSEPSIEIDKSKIPAGDYLTLMMFRTDSHPAGGVFGLTVGQQKTCVPEYSDVKKPQG